MLRHGCPPLYVGQPDDTAVGPFMKSVGYAAEAPCTPRHQKCECDMRFIRQGGPVPRALGAVRREWRAATREAAHWRKGASTGFCGTTSEAQGNDCDGGQQGTFSLDLPLPDAVQQSKHGVWVQAIAQCLSALSRAHGRAAGLAHAAVSYQSARSMLGQFHEIVMWYVEIS